jgi:tRNA dimethylallyltransferase
LIRGQIDLKAALQTAQQAHRNYAKRQMTWFRREPDVQWLAGFGDEVSVKNEAMSRVASSK